MGEQQIKSDSDTEALRIFMRKLLDDLRALEQMLETGCFETGVTRIGAEQEMFLVDHAHRPALAADEILETIDDPHFTTELGRFNLECNLDPLVLGGDCLSRLETQLRDLLAKASAGAREHGAEILLTGILPTLEKSDLTLANMTPRPRYYVLAEAMQKLRGSDFQFHIKGRDELTITHDSVMLEACCTSFQVHLQVDPADFARLYNIAQLITAPVLAAATNSPLLFGHRLWAETRIAVFRQAVDTRAPHADQHRQTPARVIFGDRWIDRSVLEIFREHVARYRLVISTAIDEDPFEKLARGEAPELRALRLHNGTVYRWNRPCYGVMEGKPHLRIENRVLPSGPTILDEVANAALWYGLLKAVDEEYGDVRRHVDFGDVRENFLASARLGLKGQFTWPGRGVVAVPELLLTELLPKARAGLAALGIDSSDVDRYCGVLEERIRSRQTGAQWLVDSLAGMKEGSPAERLASLTGAALARQLQQEPVHTWPLAQLREILGREAHYSKVKHLMTSDLFTVNEDEVIDLVACLMDWKHIRRVPVEDNEHRLVGLVTHRSLLRLLAREHTRGVGSTSVRSVMQRDLITVGPETSSLDALLIMKEHRIGCLPVVEGGRLVGIITEWDFMRVAEPLLEDFLRGDKLSSADQPGTRNKNTL